MKSALLVLCLGIKTINTQSSYERRHAYSFLNTLTCFGSNMTSTYEYGTYPPGEENQYYLEMPWKFEAGTIVKMRFRSKAFVELVRPKSKAELSQSTLENTFVINVYKTAHYLNLIVKGPVNGNIPYFDSVLVGDDEKCRVTLVGVLDDMVRDSRISAQVRSSLSVENCGQRKIYVTELIVNGQSSKPADWPWHAAVYRLKRTTNSYICGGTLISKFYVLTVTVHEDFGSPQHLDNDIAILKLLTEAVYNNYVQPACLWSSDTKYNPPTNVDILGTVVGWGVSQATDKTLPLNLKQTSLPMVSESTCIKSNPIFYGKRLSNDRKFCAGWRNGTSPCNGDSGGGFMIFIPDEGSDDNRATGAWYVRGIVSVAIPSAGTNICDPEQHVVFTDVLKYEIWIQARTRKDVPCRC